MMRTMSLYYTVLVLALVCLLPACWFGGWFQKKKTGLLVVNVLSEQLYDDCHIKGSVNVPFQELDSLIKNLDRDAHVVFYCSNYMCTSSGYAGKRLKDLGFEHVWVYEGGTAEWYQMGLPVEGPCTQSYLRKPMDPIAQDVDVPVLTAQELACKMGLLQQK